MSNYKKYELKSDNDLKLCNVVKHLGDGNYSTGLLKLKLLRDYWYAKIDPQYSRYSKESILKARNKMTIKKEEEAIVIWKKLLAYSYEAQKTHVQALN